MRNRLRSWRGIAPLLFLALGFLGTKPLNAAFSVAWTAPLSDDNRGVAWADFNNDCKPDLILVNNQPGSCVRIFRNDGGGSFTLVYTSTQADRCVAVATADYDGDGFVDFAVANYSNIPSRVYHNDGAFSFSVAWNEPYAEYSTGVDWGDYDNDGRPDLVINSLTVSGVRYFHNNGGGVFVDAGLAATPGNAASTKFADYNADGYLDLFEGVTGYGSVIWKGNGTAAPLSILTLPWNNNSDSDWKDFDGDGKPDLIEAEYITVFRNAGSDTFPIYGTGGDSQYVRGADYDVDGLCDYVTSEWAPRSFSVLHNNGAGAFVTIAGPAVTGGPVAWGDYDGDGGPDILGGCFQGPAQPAVVYHNDGTGFVPGFCPGTITPTRTATATRTATFTSTATPTRTVTVTPTATFTRTGTSTPTLALTATQTRTPTQTHTRTVTSTPTTTRTLTRTGTPTATRTPSFTATITWTPTVTLTPQATIAFADVFEVDRNVFTPSQESLSIHVEYTQFPGDYALWVYNTEGEHIFTLDSQTVTGPLSQTYTWNGTNKFGEPCASGIYILYLVEPYGRKVKKVLLVR